MNSRKRMTLKGALAIALVLLLPVAPLAAHAAAAPDLAGVWQGKLAVDANTSLAVQFTFTKGSNGAYTAVLNSPDNPALKNTPVSGVTWDGTNLKLQVPSLSGSFAGALKGNSIGGQWTQPGATLPLSLAPYQKPVMTASTVKSLTGSWHGELVVANGVKQNVAIQIKEANGELQGTFGLPDQGANLPITNVAYESGEVTMKIQQGQALFDYKGKVAGDAITGKLKVPSPAAPPDGFTLDLKRGEYKAVVAALKLTAESFAKLSGKWQGPLELTNPQNGQKRTINLVLRFETNDKGQYVGYLDSPDQGAKGLVVSEATFADGKVTAKIPLVGGEFNGTLADKTLTGEWAQPAANLKQQVTLTHQ
jgi:hypothetical protein